MPSTLDLRRGQVVGDASRRAVNLNTVTKAVANTTYAPIASPVFTGDPKAPTPAPGDSDTSVATTAFVHAAVAAGGPYLPTAGGSLTGTLNITNGGSLVADAGAPAASAYGVYGAQYSCAQLLCFNAYFDSGAAFRTRTTGISHYINADNTGNFTLNIASAPAAAGAVASSTPRFQVQSGGACVNTTGSWTTFSDASVKTDVRPYERGLDAILALRPVSFRYNEESPFGGDDAVRHGLMAQEVAPHIPEAVGRYRHITRDGREVDLATLDPGHMVYVLINSCKELAAKNSALETRLAKLKAEIDALKGAR